MISEGDVIDYTKSYDNTLHAETAQREGFLTKRYYNMNGDEVSEEEASQILSSKKNAERIFNAGKNIQDDTLRQQMYTREARDILKSRGISLKYAVDPVSAVSQKVLLETEKSFGNFVIAGLGEFNDSIAWAIGALSNKNFEEWSDDAKTPRLDMSVIKNKDRLEAYLKKHRFLEQDADLGDRLIQAGFFKKDSNGNKTLDYQKFIHAAREER